MTAAGVTLEGLFGARGRLRAIPLRPAEGWLTLAAAAVMAMTFALSLRDAGWIPGRAGDSDYLPWVALAGLAVGFIGAKVGWGRWRTHLVGGLFGGFALSLIMGGIALDPLHVGLDPAGLAMRMGASYDTIRGVWLDLVVQARPFTSQTAHYHLGIGTLVWGAGQLAGFTVFGHRRPLDAIVVIGLAILANMLLTSRDQLVLLVIYSSAALLLLIRTHVFEEEGTWTRRRIGDPSVVGRLYLRGGSVFVALAIVGSIMLTATASSKPLQGLWADLPQTLMDASQWLQRFAPPGGDPRGLGIVGFGQNAVTTGEWRPSDQVAFRAQVGSFETRQVKWRAGVYADYTTFGWAWGETSRLPTPARAILLANLGDAPQPPGTNRREFRARITPDAFRDRTILSPQAIQWVDRPSEARIVGAGGWFTTVESTEGSGVYNISALIPVFQDVQGGLTQARLRTAGRDYPPELLAIYTRLPEGSLGPASTALLEDIRGAVVVPPDAPPDNAFDLALTMESYLRDTAHFTYSTDVRTARTRQCGGVSSVECFAIIRAGYCEYYASTMAVLLRSVGVPARVAYGFLPGERGADGTEIVGAWSAHWWVEVYFPGGGWVEFDPTGGGVGRPQALPSGSVGPPTARPSLAAPTFRDDADATADTSTPAGGGNTSTGIGPFIAIAIILVLGVGALALAALRRTPRKPMHPDQAWGSVARLAARFGLGPRPSQTVYEYAGALGDALPDVRVELTTIARAKVEVAYGRRDLGTDRLRRIAEAYQRLRFALLSFVLRRVLRRRRRR
jgi:transglutaminase-like putative cysteine protease